MSIASVVLGTISIIISFICLWNTWYVTFAFALAGIVTGFAASKFSTNPAVAKAGIILSFIGLAFMIIFIVAYGFMADFFTQMNV